MKRTIVASLSLLVVLVSHFAASQGYSWKKVNGSKYACAVAINGRDHVFVATADGSIVRSTDDGEHWTELSTGYNGPFGFNHMVIDSQGNVYACTKDVYRSTDNGGTWSIVFNNPLETYGIVAKASGKLFVAACLTGVICSTDYGVTWSKVLDKDAHGIVIGPSGEVIAARFRSTDNGETWNDYGFFCTSMAYDSKGNIFASDDMWYHPANIQPPRRLYRSTDNGQTWGMIYAQGMYDIIVDHMDQIFAGGPSGGVVTSLDGGLHWRGLNEGLTDTCVYSLRMNSKGVIFAGTEGGVYRSVQTGPNEIEIVSAVPQTSSLSQNYPNPFNPMTKIQFSIVDRQLTIVKVYDVLGRDVATLVNEVKEPGTYNVEFDGSGLSSGVYFYQMKSGRFVQTKRLLLLR